MPISIEQEDAYWRAECERTGIPSTPPKLHPCGTCPWRLKYATAGGPEENPNWPGGGTEVIEDAWLGVGYDDDDGGAREGRLVLCHRGVFGDLPHHIAEYITDESCVCTASLAIQQREMIRFHEGRPSGLAEDAAERIARRTGIPPKVFRARILTRSDLLLRAQPAITDTQIGHPALAPVEPGEFEPDTELRLFDVRVEPLDATVRERIERVPGFEVLDEQTIRVAASSAEVAAFWLVERIDAP